MSSAAASTRTTASPRHGAGRSAKPSTFRVQHAGGAAGQDDGAVWTRQDSWSACNDARMGLGTPPSDLSPAHLGPQTGCLALLDRRTMRSIGESRICYRRDPAHGAQRLARHLMPGGSLTPAAIADVARAGVEGEAVRGVGHEMKGGHPRVPPIGARHWRAMTRDRSFYPRSEPCVSRLATAPSSGRHPAASALAASNTVS